MHTLTTGAEVSTQRALELQGACLTTVGRITRLADIVTVAGEVLAFYAEIGNDLVFRAIGTHAGTWLYWNGKYWQEYPEFELRKDIVTLVPMSSKQLTETTRTMEATRSQRMSAFDSKDLVTFENGNLELVGGVLKSGEHDKADLSTIYIPHTLAAQSHPEWTKILERTFPNLEDRDCVQEMFGYSLFPGYSAQVMFLLFGDGGTGKGTITKVLAELVGLQRRSSAKLSTLGETHGLAQLVGAYINIDSEAEYLSQKDEIILKAITGGDSVTINEKFKPQYSVRLPVRMIMACNEIPKFNDKTSALWSRLVAIPFDVVVPEGDRVEEGILFERVKPELGAIAAWGIKGLQRVLARKTIRNAAFTQSARAKEILGTHREFSDPFIDWYETHIVIEVDAATAKDDIYGHYRNWCTRNGYKAVAENRFGAMMHKRGHADTHLGREQKRKRAWSGVVLDTHPETSKGPWAKRA